MARSQGDPQLAWQVGQRVRRRRTSLTPFMSQERLALLAGVHPTYVGHVERGRTNVTLCNLVRIAMALDLDPGELVRGLAVPVPGRPVAEPIEPATEAWPPDEGASDGRRRPAS